MTASSLAILTEERERLRRRSRPVVFTNGCFDLLHTGHIELLEQARGAGTTLYVGINSDASVRRLKGARRPVLPAAERAETLCALEAVDRVVIYEEDTPLETIGTLLPDVLVKGDDWPLERIVGRRVVEAAGGRVVRIPLLTGHSTTALIGRLRKP